MLTFRMNSPTHHPPLRELRSSTLGERLFLRLLCGLRVLCVKLSAPFLSSALFPHCQKQSPKPQIPTPFFSVHAFHSLLTLFALPEISPAFATLTKNIGGTPSRSPQNRNYSSDPAPPHFSARSACPNRFAVSLSCPCQVRLLKPFHFQVSILHSHRHPTSSESSTSFTSSTSVISSTSLAPVAARSPRCHTLISRAARIFARDAIVWLGCAHWGLYGIA